MNPGQVVAAVEIAITLARLTFELLVWLGKLDRFLRVIERLRLSLRYAFAVMAGFASHLKMKARRSTSSSNLRHRNGRTIM